MSYGFGPRFFLLGMPWQLDYVLKVQSSQRTISRKWYLLDV